MIQDWSLILLPLLWQEREMSQMGATPDPHTLVVFGSIAASIVRSRQRELVDLFIHADPDVFPAFFAGTNESDSTRIVKWFSHFKFDGPPELGALALEHYAFANREWFWDQNLGWLAARAPTPVVAAAQRHLMMQLDVISSVRSLIPKNETRSLRPQETRDGRDGSGFWTSPQWVECVRAHTKKLFAIDPQFWTDRIVQCLLTSNASSNEYWRLVSSCMTQMPPTEQIRSLFSGLSDPIFWSALKKCISLLDSNRIKANRGAAAAGAAQFRALLECLAPLLDASDYDRAIFYASLFDFSSQTIRILTESASALLSELQRERSAFTDACMHEATKLSIDSSIFNDLAHSFYFSRQRQGALQSATRFRHLALQALLLQIDLLESISSGGLTQQSAEELFVREGVSCEVVEVTRVKRSKKHKRHKKEHKRSKDGSSEFEPQVIEAEVRTTEFLGWRLGDRPGKRTKTSDNDINREEEGEIVEPQDDKDTAVLLTLQDLPQWFHDAYLQRYTQRES